MEFVIMAVGGLTLICFIGILVCSIMEIIAAFKNEESPLLGILSIVFCGLGSFIIGWIKHKEWGISKLMMTFSILLGAYILLQVIGVVVAVAAGAAAQNGQF